MPRLVASAIASARSRWSLLAVTVIYLITLGLMPRQGQWIVDNENRYLQAAALVAADFREYAIPWPGRDLDPSFSMNPLRFNPEGSFQEVKDGQLISVFQPTFIVLSALAYKFLGLWGLYLLPVGGAVLTLAAVGRLARALGLGKAAAHLAVLLAGLATPLWFYSQTFWEHTMAAGLCVWGVVHTVRFLEERSWRQLKLGSVFLVGAVFFRDVLLIFAAVLLLLLVIRVREQRLRTAMTAGAVFGVGLALLMVLQWITTGRPLGFHAGTLMNAETGLAAHLKARPLIFYLYFVASHPERAWSFVLAAPFLAAFFIRPRVSSARVGRAVALWGLAAAAAGVVFLVGFLTAASPPQRMLLANGFFLASPVVILGLLRVEDDGRAAKRPRAESRAESRVASRAASRTESRAESRVADLVRSAVALHFVLYCLVAPWAGAVSLHWGGRLVFSLYPLLAVLAAGTLARWFAMCGHRLSWRAAALILLLLVSCGGQVYALSILGQKKAFSTRLARALEGVAPRVVVTNVWWAGHEMYASFFDRTIFYVKTQAQFDTLAAALRTRGIDEVVLATRPQPGAGAHGAVRVDDGTWGFYSLELFVTDLP